MYGMDARSEFKDASIDHSEDRNASSIPVPLPTEIPPPPDFSSLPPSILHSGTVETLIGLNEDLMARLKVNIRRNGILEQQILENEKVHTELARVNKSLVSQLQVLQEKDRFTREKSSRFEALKNENSVLHGQVRALGSFHRRVRAWVRPLIHRLKSELNTERVRAQIAEDRVLTKEAQLSDVRSKLTEAISHIQNQEKKFSKDQAKLVEQYESQKSQIEKDLEKLRNEAKYLREKAARMDEAVARRTEADNRIVYLERRIQELEKSFHTELTEFQEQAAKYRHEAKMLAVETLELDRKLREATEKFETKNEAHQKLQDQFESLQALWADAQKKLEASRLQQESLNKLNQELSRQLKEQRKAREEGSNEAPPSPVSAAAATVDEAKSSVLGAQRMKKIDSLLAELESGFMVQRTPEACETRNLEIIESAKQSDSSAKEPEAGA